MSLIPPERIALFRQYQVDYLLLRGDPDWYLTIMEEYPQHFNLIQETPALRLIQFIP